mgnify:CR=1 FL=1
MIMLDLKDCDGPTPLEIVKNVSLLLRSVYSQFAYLGSNSNSDKTFREMYLTNVK